MNQQEKRIVSDWLKTWPQDVGAAIVRCVPNFWTVVKPRTSDDGKPCISAPIESTYQLVINYCRTKKCYIVWNATIQNKIHKGKNNRPAKKIHPTMGVNAMRILEKSINPDSVTPTFRDCKVNGKRYVECVYIIGGNALIDFCENYRDKIKPDVESIPKGKVCLYSETDGTVHEISGKK